MDQKPKNLVANGGMKLPIGYRFHPTDEELLVHYLKRKVFGLPLPASVIPEIDVFQTDPWNLPGDLKETRYFFGKRKGNESESKWRAAAGSGYWKHVGKRRQIVASASNQAVGMRRTLVFCEGKRINKSKTHQWVMHEYHLLGLATFPNSIQLSKVILGDWVVYRVFQRKRRPNKKRGAISKPSNTINKTATDNEVISPSFMNFRMEEIFDAGPHSPSSSSTCSSGITDDEAAASDVLDQGEVISSFFSFSSYSCNKKT